MSASVQDLKKNVKVQIKYFVTLKEQTGRSQEQVSFPQGSVPEDVARWLNKHYDLSLPNPRVIAILNGRGWEQFVRDNVDGKKLPHEEVRAILEACDKTPDDLITIAAGVAMVWYTGCDHVNPLTSDVTAFYITNSSGETATIEIHVLQDSTP